MMVHSSRPSRTHAMGCKPLFALTYCLPLSPPHSSHAFCCAVDPRIPTLADPVCSALLTCMIGSLPAFHVVSAQRAAFPLSSFFAGFTLFQVFSIKLHHLTSFHLLHYFKCQETEDLYLVKASIKDLLGNFYTQILIVLLMESSRMRVRGTVLTGRKDCTT